MLQNKISYHFFQYLFTHTAHTQNIYYHFWLNVQTFAAIFNSLFCLSSFSAHFLLLQEKYCPQLHIKKLLRVNLSSMHHKSYFSFILKTKFLLWVGNKTREKINTRFKCCADFWWFLFSTFSHSLDFHQ